MTSRSRSAGSFRDRPRRLVGLTAPPCQAFRSATVHPSKFVVMAPSDEANCHMVPPWPAYATRARFSSARNAWPGPSRPTERLEIARKARPIGRSRDIVALTPAVEALRAPTSAMDAPVDPAPSCLRKPLARIFSSTGDEPGSRDHRGRRHCCLGALSLPGHDAV